MELEKLLSLRSSLKEADKRIFDASYDTIIKLFLDSISSATKVLVSGTIEDTCDFDNGMKSAKIINELGEKYGVKIKVPYSDKNSFFIYLLKMGTEILKYHEYERDTQPKLF